MYIRVAFGNLANYASYICCDLISFSVPVDANITCFFLDAKKGRENIFIHYNAELQKWFTISFNSFSTYVRSAKKVGEANFITLLI